MCVSSVSVSDSSTHSPTHPPTHIHPPTQVLEGERTFVAVDFAALWTGIVVCVPAYFLAASLVQLGMTWTQGVFTVFVSNMVTLVPMVLNGHVGVKYGIPFPVAARAAFGGVCVCVFVFVCLCACV